MWVCQLMLYFYTFSNTNRKRCLKKDRKVVLFTAGGRTVEEFKCIVKYLPNFYLLSWGNIMWEVQFTFNHTDIGNLLLGVPILHIFLIIKPETTLTLCFIDTKLEFMTLRTPPRWSPPAPYWSDQNNTSSHQISGGTNDILNTNLSYPQHSSLRQIYWWIWWMHMP